MTKFSKISVVAAIAVAGTIFMAGCGSSSSGGSAGVKAADGYIIPNDKNASKVTYVHAGSVVGKYLSKGSWTFPGATGDYNITVDHTAVVDVDMNDEYNVSVDKQLGFQMIAPKDSLVVSQLTTIALKTGNTALLEKAKTFDPVAKLSNITDDNTLKLLKLGELAKAVLKYAPYTDLKTVFKDVNVSDLNITSIQTTAIAILPNKVQPFIKAKISALDAIKKAVESGDIKASDVAKVVVRVSDGGQTLTDALKNADINTSDINETILQDMTNLDIDLNSANLPAVLAISKVKVGDETLTLNGNKFTADINTTGKKLADYYSISFPDVSIDKGFNPQTVNATLDIKTGNKEVNLTINGAQISPNDDNTSVEVSLPTASQVTVEQVNIAGLQSIVGIKSEGYTDNPLEMKDLSFNVNTVLKALGTTSKITQAINKLNDYLQKEKSYTVTISFSGLDTDKIVVPATTFIGTINVGGAEASEPGSGGNQAISCPTGYTLGSSNDDGYTKTKPCYKGTPYGKVWVAAK